MLLQQYIDQLIQHQFTPQQNSSSAFAPSNIALVKYWGKRNLTFNLPTASSLSVSLPHGTNTKITIHSEPNAQDQLTINNQTIDPQSQIFQRTFTFINYFRKKLKNKAQYNFSIETTNDLPTAAGLATSASGFAALVLALDQLYAWNLPKQQLSILARIGSGSACRSLWPGFVKWNAGSQADGSDSYASPIHTQWPQLCLGILLIEANPKKISSSAGMLHTQKTSPLYSAWPTTVNADLAKIEQAIAQQDFNALGHIAEYNALAMHATMLAARPSLSYSTAKTWQTWQQIQQYREQGLPIFATQDAGPNLKLLFEKQDIPAIKDIWPNLEVIKLFS